MKTQIIPRITLALLDVHEQLDRMSAFYLLYGRFFNNFANVILYVFLLWAWMTIMISLMTHCDIFSWLEQLVMKTIVSRSKLLYYNQIQPVCLLTFQPAILRSSADWLQTSHHTSHFGRESTCRQAAMFHVYFAIYMLFECLKFAMVHICRISIQSSWSSILCNKFCRSSECSHCTGW